MRKTRVTIPDRVNSQWIGTLGNDQLVAAEAQLHAEFVKQETAEKRRSGARYVMLEGPEALVNSWLRWVAVNKEARARGVFVYHTAGARAPRAT